jgi:hypothetical protein
MTQAVFSGYLHLPWFEHKEQFLRDFVQLVAYTRPAYEPDNFGLLRSLIVWAG